MIYEFPSIPVSGQLFYTPGIYSPGGFTVGGAKISTFEPGGFAMLEILPSLQTTEWVVPVMSWLMSKTNGEVLRFRLAPTPQVAYSERRDGVSLLTWQDGVFWSGDVEWVGDITVEFAGASAAGSNTATIDTTATGPILAVGHVIGHDDSTYLIDQIGYVGPIATVVVKPPFRRAVLASDNCYLRPWFTGQITNGQEIRSMYDASNVGHIQPGKIVLSEVVT